MSFFVQLFLHPATFYRAHELLIGQAGVNALLAVSIWVTLWCGLLTLANVGFMAIGGYVSVIMAIHWHTPLPLNMAAGCLLSGLVALVIGVPVLRLKGVFLAIATVGFGEAIRFGIILNLNITGKGQGLNNPHASPTGGLLPIWISVAVITYALWRATQSRIGAAWAAIREDELAAAGSAIDVTRFKLAAFVIGAVIASFAGSLDAHLNFFIDPTEYAFNRAVLVLIFAVVGGIATVVGPIAGAVLLTSLPEVFRFARDYRDVVDGGLLMLIMIFRPQGLVGRMTVGRRGRRHAKQVALEPAPP